jgi:hypothetical protein
MGKDTARIGALEVLGPSVLATALVMTLTFLVLIVAGPEGERHA